jgi:hypothetical protein
MPESERNTFGSLLPIFRLKDVNAAVSYYFECSGLPTAIADGPQLCVRRVWKLLDIVH